MSPVEKYIHAIKNPSKKAYAQAYAKHIRQGGPEPERPKNLSYMGAQAVRMSLYELTSPKHETGNGDAYLERFARPVGGKKRHAVSKDERLLAGMRNLGVVWKKGRALPTYKARMTQAQKLKADKLYDQMSEGFIDEQGVTKLAAQVKALLK